MSELNRSQSRIAEETEGMVVVDAGPGTGKTHTIVRRYINILRKPDVDVKDIILLTFTKNAAAEMGERIRGGLSDESGDPKLSKASKFVQAGTFDSFCFSAVMESPESVSRFFRMDEKLTRGARLIENDTLNQGYFSDFMDRFLADSEGRYGEHAAVASQNATDMFKVIESLMSKGIVPLRSGWFGGDDGRDCIGDEDALLERMTALNGPDGKGTYRAKKAFIDRCVRKSGEFSPLDMDPDTKSPIPDRILSEAAHDDRTGILELVHDIYYEYIRRSITDNRLTFGLVSSFAFIVLYKDAKTRERMSCRYLMIDEFQDTNSNQLMIALMLLKEPNLCVVGDWKQSIYGFRHVTSDNIVNFEERVRSHRDALNDDITRVPFVIPEVVRLSLDMNYRSSQEIIDAAYRSLYLPATADDDVDKASLDRNITPITAERDDIGGDTAVEYVRASSADEEVAEVLRRMVSYVESGRFTIHEDGVSRPPDYGDIAVLCRNTRMCRVICEAAARAGVPVFLQGDVEIMCTREGKLALAWLRYVNNPSDSWGIGAILADMGYPLSRIRSMIPGRGGSAPAELESRRASLLRKKRRITDLLTSVFSMYDLNNDITQTIISVISSSHRNSLITISDLIGMIETDIRMATRYPVDGSLDRRAATVQTMHKSKGLEYPIVIVAGIDLNVFPSMNTSSSVYRFGDLAGIRCSREVSHFGDGLSRISKSWKTELVWASEAKDYSEERRLMFVAVSRAKQYVTMVSGSNPSEFMKSICENPEPQGSGRPSAERSGSESVRIERPAMDRSHRRRINIGVHDILRFGECSRPGEGGDEFPGKGMEYGTRVHEAAYAMAMGWDVGDDLPEMPAIRSILDSLSDADLLYPEKECSLPFNGLNTTLRGVADLIAVYPDRVVIHDYKTDAERTNQDEYVVQLSVYAHAASGFYGLPARCVIDYVSRGETFEFDPVDIGVIEQRLRESDL